MPLNTIYYAEVNLICMVLLFLVRRQMHATKYGQRSTDRVIFSVIIWISVVMCASDLIAGCSRGHFYWGALWVLEIFNGLFMEAIAIISYLWWLYVTVKLGMVRRLSNKQQWLVAVPLLLFTVVILTNPLTHVMYTFDDQNLYHRGNGVYLHWLVTWFYLIFSTLITLRAMRNEKSKQKRREIAPLLSFIIAPIITSVIQMLFYGVTSSQVGVTLSVLLAFLSIQDNQVLTDALTGLSNRRGLLSYIENVAQHESGATISLLMLDLNGFKQINDRFGHMVGDDALKQAADAFQTACETFPGKLLLCRYGGDEFVVVGIHRHAKDMERVKKQIDAELFIKNEARCDSYKLEVSGGIASGVFNEVEDIERLIHMADRAMYVDKNSGKTARVPMI